MSCGSLEYFSYGRGTPVLEVLLQQRPFTLKCCIRHFTTLDKAYIAVR